MQTRYSHKHSTRLAVSSGSGTKANIYIFKVFTSSLESTTNAQVRLQPVTQNTLFQSPNSLGDMVADAPTSKEISENIKIPEGFINGIIYVCTISIEQIEKICTLLCIITTSVH